MGTRIGYFPGCSLHSSAREFDESLKAVTAALDVTLAEVDDWSCCGASSAHATDHLLSVVLPARNLALAEAQGLDDVLAPCAACFNRLAGARHEMEGDRALTEKVTRILDRPFANGVAVRNVADLLLSLVPEIKAKAAGRLKGKKVACYYGCLLVRPAEVCAFDDPESPTSLETIVAATGATPVAWNMRLECCGGGFSLSRTASVVRLGRAILEDARRAGAEALLVACPMCHSNLDFRQEAMTRRGETPMPVLYVTELVGLALGLSPEALGLPRHFVDAATFAAASATPPAALAGKEA